MPLLSSWLPSPGSAQPQPWICQADLLLSLLLSGLSPLPFPPLPLFSSYCPYLVMPYYLPLSAKASNL